MVNIKSFLAEENVTLENKFCRSNYLSYFCKSKNIFMCTCSISINNSVMGNVRLAFPYEESLSHWVQQQIELLTIRYAATLEKPTSKPQKLSQRLRGIATDPKDFDYKQELANRSSM